MDGKRGPKHGRPLRRLHQHRRSESDGARRGKCSHEFDEPVQLSDSQRKLHVVRPGGRKAEHCESDVGPGEILGWLPDEHNRQRDHEWRHKFDVRD